MRNRLYLALMALCLGMFVSAWAVVRLYSVTAAVIMSAVAVGRPGGWAAWALRKNSASSRSHSR